MYIYIYVYIHETAVFFIDHMALCITVYKRKKNEFLLYIKEVNLRKDIFLLHKKIYKLGACISLSKLCKLIGGRNPVWGTRTWCLSVVLNVR